MEFEGLGMAVYETLDLFTSTRIEKVDSRERSLGHLEVIQVLVVRKASRL